MRDLLFPSSPVHRGALAESARLQAKAFVMECRAIAGMYDTAEPTQREFVHGDVAGTLHLAPRTAQDKVATALELMEHPRLVVALDSGRLGVGHAMALLQEISHLSPRIAEQVLAAVVGESDAPVDATAGELRAAVKNAAPAGRRGRSSQASRGGEEERHCPQPPGRRRDGAGRRRLHRDADGHDRGVGSQPGRGDGVGRGAHRRAEAGRGPAARTRLRPGQGAGGAGVPGRARGRPNAVARSGVWGLDVRIPVAAALGLSDHPALLAGYGPIGADEARALLPAADLVRACVDAGTGEALAVDRPLHAKTWQGGDLDLAAALRAELIRMATTGGTIPDLTTDGHVPGEALGRLVDLRDVTSVFPGDSTSSRRTDRDHRLPYPLGPTAEWNLQNITRRWHRAKTQGWHTRADPDGVVIWTSPSRGVYRRKPKRTVPPKIPSGSSLPPLPDEAM